MLAYGALASCACVCDHAPSATTSTTGHRALVSAIFPFIDRPFRFDSHTPHRGEGYHPSSPPSVVARHDRTSRLGRRARPQRGRKWRGAEGQRGSLSPPWWGQYAAAPTRPPGPPPPPPSATAPP